MGLRLTHSADLAEHLGDLGHEPVLLGDPFRWISVELVAGDEPGGRLRR